MHSLNELRAIGRQLGVAIALNGIDLTDLEDALGRLHDWIEGQGAEGRAEYVVLPRGEAILGEMRRNALTPEAARAKAEQDVDDLYGTREERAGIR